MDPKVYEIAGVKCRLNFDQTLREVKEIDEMIARSQELDLSIEDAERLLQIVLKSDQPVEYLDIRESQLTEIITEYFKQKKNWSLNMAAKWVRSAIEENGLNPSYTDLEKPETVT